MLVLYLLGFQGERVCAGLRYEAAVSSRRSADFGNVAGSLVFRRRAGNVVDARHDQGQPLKLKPCNPSLKPSKTTMDRISTDNGVRLCRHRVVMSSKGCKTDNIRHSLSCKKQKTRPKESESKVGGQRACSIAIRVRGRRAGDPLSSGISIAQWSVGLGGWPGLRTPDSERAGTLVQGGGFNSSWSGSYMCWRT